MHFVVDTICRGLLLSMLFTFSNLLNEQLLAICFSEYLFDGLLVAVFYDWVKD